MKDFSDKEHTSYGPCLIFFHFVIWQSRSSMKSIQLFPVYIIVPLFSVFLFLTNFVETPFVSLIRLAHSFPCSHGYMSVSIRIKILGITRNLNRLCDFSIFLFFMVGTR